MFRFITSLWTPSTPDHDDVQSIINKHPRSTRWSKCRRDILAAYPFCAVCGNAQNIVPHHIKPYHLHPELELDEKNLIVLCEGPVVNCHYLFGHLRNWKSWNPEVVAQAIAWAAALKKAKTPNISDDKTVAIDKPSVW